MALKMVGLDRFAKKMANAPTDLRRRNLALMNSLVIKMDADVKRTIQLGSRSGVIYKRGKKAFHQASAPGEPPKTDRGGLVRGFYFGVIKGSGASAIGYIGNRSAHAAPLEYKPQSMGGRPFMSPLASRWREFIKKNFRLNVQLSVKDR